MWRFLKSILKIITPIRLTIAVIIFLFLWLLFFGDQGIYQLNKLTLLKQRLLYQKDMLKKDVEKLTKEKEMLKDPRNLEPVIRRELGYIRNGEVIFQEKESKSEKQPTELTK